MFVGRTEELASLEKSYTSDGFSMVVVYGRRRVGKTTLLAHFAEDKDAIFYTAQQQSAANNLSDFSRLIASHFGLPAELRFQTWDAAFDFLGEQAADRKLLLVFDEFPYAAEADPSLPSKLQVAIDHKLRQTQLCLVLCGSNQGFMEHDVLGKKSPLHGRRTSQIRVRPFGYREAALMVPNARPDEAFRYYACIGGIPYYLAQVDISSSFEQNIARLFFNTEGFLYEEPQMLLRQELREPAIYNSILRAIAGGANRQTLIADRCGLLPTGLSRYLQTLISLDIIERLVPFGANAETSKKGIYRIKDNCYAFWYAFVMERVGDIETGTGMVAWDAIRSTNALETFLGRQFEHVCLEWLVGQALAGELPIRASQFGTWWGTDPATRQQTDIDVIAADRASKRAIIGECKYRGSFDETAVLDDLSSKRELVKGYDADYLALFSKAPCSSATAKKVSKGEFGSVMLVTLDDMYA